MKTAFCAAIASLALALTASGWTSSRRAQPQADGQIALIGVQIGEGTTLTESVSVVDHAAMLRDALPSLPAANAEVVRTLLSYPRDGAHAYWWPRKGESSYDGCTTDVVVNGLPAMRGESKGRTFCCGLTLEVYYLAAAKAGHDFSGATSESLAQFKDAWFCRKINSPGPLDALSESGKGFQVKDWDAALPGDFVQLWRNDKTGHSVVFVAWAHDRNGRRIGMHYWSTQPATSGIGFRTELFGTRGKTVSKDLTSIARAN